MVLFEKPGKQNAQAAIGVACAKAKELEAQGTDFNIVIGLCVGHDTLFLRHSHAPTTVMIVKDRVLAHNPVAALYTANGMYSRFKNILQR